MTPVGRPARTCRLRTAAGVDRSRQVGFSLIELALALLVLGALGVLLSGAYRGLQASQTLAAARADGEAARQALHAFLIAHRRLPCPDGSGDGREGDAGGACPAGLMVGWLPDQTLGLPPRPGARPLYGVYRHPDAGIDLTRPGQTPAAGSGSYEHDGLAAIQRQLVEAATQPVSAARIHLTGDQGVLGAADCAGNVVANPAVLVLLPASDRDADGDPFDGVHAGYATTPGRCFAAPTLPFDHRYDDVLVADSPHTLLGWLAAGIQ